MYYVAVRWPDSQDLMELEGFRENSYLINDEKGIKDFGSSAYFVDADWLAKVDRYKVPDEVWKAVERTCYGAYGELDLRDEKKFTEPVELTDGRKAIGFYVDDGEEGEPIIEVIIDDGEDVDYDCIYALDTKDAGEIADLIDLHDYE